MHRLFVHINPILLVLILLAGCSSYMHGYTKRDSFDRYLLVDSESMNFGYKRIEYVRGYRDPINGFIDKHGLPDFIYEFEQNGREGLKMYYVGQDEVYIFLEANWKPNSIFLSEHRSLSDYEKSTYAELLKSKSDY